MLTLGLEGNSYFTAANGKTIPFTAARSTITTFTASRGERIYLENQNIRQYRILLSQNAFGRYFTEWIQHKLCNQKAVTFSASAPSPPIA